MLRLSATLLAMVAATAAFAADAVFPPGSRIGLVPPKNMQPARGMAGFQDPATGAAIVAVEMPPEAYPSVAAGFADEALKAQNFTVKSRDKVKVGAVEAMILSGEQTEGGRTTTKSFLLAAEPTLTALVIAQAPAGAPPAAHEQLRAALKTVAIRAPLSIDQQVAALPFRIGDPAGFRPVRAMAGNSVLLTEGPNESVKGVEQPTVILAQSFAPAPPTAEQRDVFARSALGQNTLLKDIVLERAQGFRLGGVDWHEIVAKGKDTTSDQPVIVMQTIRFAPDGYLRMVALARQEQRDEMMPRFRRVVDGLAPK